MSDSLRPRGLLCTQASLSFTVSQSLLKLMSIESVMLSNYLILCHPLLLLPSIFPSIRVFSNESVLQSGNQSIGAAALVADFFLELTGLVFLRVHETLNKYSLTSIKRECMFLFRKKIPNDRHEACHHKKILISRSFQVIQKQTL